MTDRKSLRRGVLLLALMIAVLFLLGIIPPLDSRYRPSGSPAYLPVAGDTFSYYIEQNQERIRAALLTHFYLKSDSPFGAQYPLEKVVQMRSPFELAPDSDACEEPENNRRIGFLMIHGLTDSPYLLSEFGKSLNNDFPCSTVRGLLTPGHGTVPGDLLTVNLEDWRQTVLWGIESFRPLVDELYLVGYSNGAPLAIDYVQENPGDELVSGLVLLSPGLQSARSSIAMAPWLKYVLRWVSRGDDADAVKYDSMPMHAAALFHRITEKVGNRQEAPVEQPVLMVVSGDDTTVDADFAAEYFCDRVTSEQRRLIWYSSRATGSTPASDCEGLEIVDVAVPEARFISHSHVSISMPADNEHYGLDGNYAVCNAYRDDLPVFADCNRDNINTLYGENTLGEKSEFQSRLIRRASFNPYYDEMVEAVRCFVASNCTD